jgi:hypothetical protein
MRATLPVVLLSAVAASGCVIFQEPSEPETLCDEARILLLDCGASFALFERSTCAGPTRFAAECIIDHGAVCEDLSDIGESCARVISDAINEVDPPTVPGDECQPPAALEPGALFVVEARHFRVDGLTYCQCTNAPLTETELCAPPSALVSSGPCATSCQPGANP